MRILGIDFGSKRVGVAISDEDCNFALPVMVLKNTKKLAEDVKGLADENKVREIVMGESTNYKGKPNPIQDSILAFKRQMEDLGFKVILEPEFMTSHQAEKFQGKNDMLDASAAAIILQSYLDRKLSK